MSIKQQMYVLLVIAGVALGLRLYKVWDNPPALSWDEVSIGYNAYSILKTGKDEHGRFLPLDTFIAYGDYKPPLAIYLTVPSVAIFGLNEFAVRFPSVLFGTLTVLMTYFLVKELFKKSKNYELITNNLPLLSTALLAISPWHINISRAGFEATIALFFIVLGAVLCLKARQKPKLYLVCWLPFVAAIYTFNSARYFVPFLVLGLVVFIGKNVFFYKKYFIEGIILSIVLLLPILPHLFSKQAILRFAEVNIFSDISPVVTSNNRITREGSSLLSKALNNRRVGYTYSMLTHYMDHFDPNFLFIRGDGNPKFSTQDVGQLYLIEAPLLALGIIMLLSRNAKVALFLLFWLLASIIPAATARETPHALRILNSLPTWQIFIAYGIVGTVSRIKYYVYKNNRNHKFKYLHRGFIYTISALYLLSLLYYLYNYYVHYPRLYSGEWQYGYKQALAYTNSNGSTYEKIYVSEVIGRAYMYTLFYTKYDPLKFQRNNSSYFDSAGFYHVDGFGRYIFTDTLPITLDKSSLYIFPSNQVPQNATIKQIIPLLNGDPVLTIFEK